MPRFFFNGCSQNQMYLDPEGTALPNLAAAMVEAALVAREIMAEELRYGPMTPGRSIDITAEDGQVLATVAFADCLYRDP